LVQCTKKGENIPNDHNIYQKAIKYTNGRKMFLLTIKYIYQHYPFQGPKYTQIEIWVRNHLATLVVGRRRDNPFKIIICHSFFSNTHWCRGEV
jgi:hypothetical protein